MVKQKTVAAARKLLAGSTINFHPKVPLSILGLNSCGHTVQYVGESQAEETNTTRIVAVCRWGTRTRHLI